MHGGAAIASGASWQHSLAQRCSVFCGSLELQPANRAALAALRCNGGLAVAELLELGSLSSGGSCCGAG
jgi:hypothetical protein